MRLLTRLKARRVELLAAARRRGAMNVRVFGSVARGEEMPGSDVDLLVDMQAGRSLLDLAGLQQDFERLLGHRVDVLTEDSISPYLREQVLREARPL
jgi:predicted nucleotidyltransferase